MWRNNEREGCGQGATGGIPVQTETTLVGVHIICHSLAAHIYSPFANALASHSLSQSRAHTDLRSSAAPVSTRTAAIQVGSLVRDTRMPLGRHLKDGRLISRQLHPGHAKQLPGVSEVPSLKDRYNYQGT